MMPLMKDMDETGIEDILKKGQHLLHSAASGVTRALVADAYREGSIRVNVESAANVAAVAKHKLSEGIAEDSIRDSIRNSSAYRNLEQNGGDVREFETLMMERAKLDHAADVMGLDSTEQIAASQKLGL